jgi:hypothetical protein
MTVNKKGTIMPRDPRTDPKEGDILYQAGGARELHVEKVDACDVAYRVTDGNGGLCGAYKTTLFNWKESAPHTCDRSEMFCPSCDGRGDECKIVPGGIFGKEVYVPCRMCGGSGRLYLTNAPDDCPASYAPPCEPGCDRACPVGGEQEPTKEDLDEHEGDL